MCEAEKVQHVRFDDNKKYQTRDELLFRDVITTFADHAFSAFVPEVKVQRLQSSNSLGIGHTLSPQNRQH
jgi:hypothetical protein